VLTAKHSQLLQSCKESIEAFSAPGFQSKHFHPTRAARVGTPAWAEISQRFQRTLEKTCRDYHLSRLWY
jgi:hypothetical protein